MTAKLPDFSMMSDHDVAMMEWRGHMLREYKAKGVDLRGAGFGNDAIELEEFSRLADEELTKRGINERFC